MLKGSIDYVHFNNADASTTQNQPSPSIVVNGEQNYNIDTFTILALMMKTVDSWKPLRLFQL